ASLPASPLIGSLDNFLLLRGLTDALLRRSAGWPVRSEPTQEGHAATQPELPRHSDSGDAPVGTVRRRAKASRDRNPGAPPRQSHSPPPGARQCLTRPRSNPPTSPAPPAAPLVSTSPSARQARANTMGSPPPASTPWPIAPANWVGPNSRW